MMTDLDAHYAANDNKPLYNHESVFNKKTMEAFLNRLMKYEPEFKPPQNPTDIETEYFSKMRCFPIPMRWHITLLSAILSRKRFLK